jgi:transketolase
MIHPFRNAYIKLYGKHKSKVFLTGDLGFHALEPVQAALKNRFINAGVAEQNMISVAAGLASQGMLPYVYSIAPFISIKNFEQIRNDICFPNLPVTMVGIGGGYGYGIMGSTHHVLEDLAQFTTLPNLTSYIPAFDEDLEPQLQKIKKTKSPAYVRIGLAKKHNLILPQYSTVRHIKKGSRVVVFVLGPLIHEVLAINGIDKKLYKSLDIWCVSELPATLPSNALISCRKNKNILIIEEHTEAGGLGSHLSKQLLTNNIPVKKYTHLYAKGYPSGTYGDQQFHRAESNLDTNGIIQTLRGVIK